MIDDDEAPAASRRGHIIRLALFGAFLLALFYLVAVTRVVDVENVRRTVAATGPLAPLTYVVVSAGLGAILAFNTVQLVDQDRAFWRFLGLRMVLVVRAFGGPFEHFAFDYAWVGAESTCGVDAAAQ